MEARHDSEGIVIKIIEYSKSKIRTLFCRIPLENRYKYEAQRLESNFRQFRGISTLVVTLIALYLVQYRFFPGVEKETPFFVYYVYIFFSLLIISILFRLLLPHFHKKKSSDSEEIIYLVYTSCLIIGCIYLTVFDLSVSKDYTAYAIGLLSLAFILRTSIAKYLMLIMGAFIFTVINMIYFLEINNYFEAFLPILVISVASTFIGVYSEKSRQEVFLLRYELQEKNKELQNISFRDPLTNLYNRRYLVESLSNQILHFKRYGAPLSILMVDIDHFKRVNDKLGHAVGDQTLIGLARLFERECRNSDTLARYGGEEFVIVLSNVSRKKAYVCAERIRKSAENHRFAGVPWSVTLSIGINEIGIEDELNTLIDGADKNLYEAKNSGRNKCVF